MYVTPVSIRYNHAAGIKQLYRADRSDKIYTELEIEALLSKACPNMRLAILMARDTGQRQGDLLKLSWANYTGSRIELRQSKTGKSVSIPLTTELKVALDKAKQSGICATTILTRKDGQPWKANHFCNVWKLVRSEAGLESRTFNDLRGTAVTLLSEAGGTVPEICSITGHSLKSAESILEHYLARTKRQADNAISKLEDARKRKSVNQSVNRAVSGGLHDN